MSALSAGCSATERTLHAPPGDGPNPVVPGVEVDIRCRGLTPETPGRKGARLHLEARVRNGGAEPVRIDASGVHVADRLGLELALAAVGLGFDDRGELLVLPGQSATGHLFFHVGATGAGARLSRFEVSWTYRYGHERFRLNERFEEVARPDRSETGAGFGPWNRVLDRPGPALPGEGDGGPWDRAK